jgi:hypothetical protein
MALIAAVCVPQSAFADFVVPAVDNSTVQPGGPRSGINGQRFFNLEGSSNGTFSSFGVADFIAPVGATIGPGPLLVSLILSQSDAAFSANGALQFYLTADTATNIDAGTSPLFFDNTGLPGGIGSQLTTKYLLGTGNFTVTSTGMQDTFRFFPSGPALTYLTGQITSNGRIRLIIAPNDASVAATYAGFASTSPLGPQLDILFVPEPSTLLLAPAALLLLVAARLKI